MYHSYTLLQVNDDGILYLPLLQSNTDDSVLKTVSVLKQAETTNLSTSRIFFLIKISREKFTS